MRSLFNFHDFVVFAGSIRNQFTNLLWAPFYSFFVFFFFISVSCVLYFLRCIWKSQSENNSVIERRKEPGDQLPFKTNLHLKCITKSCAHNAIFWQSHAGPAKLAVVHCSFLASWLAGFQIANQAASNGKMKMENAGGSPVRWHPHTVLSPFGSCSLLQQLQLDFGFKTIVYIYIYIYSSFLWPKVCQ